MLAVWGLTGLDKPIVPQAEPHSDIRVLKERGRTVGYLGDGINDEPSLHAADVGISVDHGVDVAKEAAQGILLESGLAAIERPVLQGRRSFGNITKRVLIETSSKEEKGG
jgi:P-type Mg2+ transporter